jgi:hypothetical protein
VFTGKSLHLELTLEALNLHGKEGVNGSSPLEGFAVFTSVSGLFGPRKAASRPFVQKSREHHANT